MDLSLDLGLKLGGVATRGGSAAESNGIAIVNAANTTVTAAAGGRSGYLITKSGGAVAWDAAANSASSSPSALLRIRFGSGDYLAGMASSAGDAGLTGITGLLSQANVLYVYSFGSVIGAARGAPPAYGWVAYDNDTNTFRYYTGATSDFGAATLIETITPIDFAAAWFDCTLNTAGANFEARFTAA